MRSVAVLILLLHLVFVLQASIEKRLDALQCYTYDALLAGSTCRLYAVVLIHKVISEPLLSVVHVLRHFRGNQGDLVVQPPRFFRQLSFVHITLVREPR